MLGSTGAQQTTIPFSLYSHSIATAVSLRKCSDTLPGHPEATKGRYAGGLCELSAVASATLPYPTIQLLTASRSTEEQMFHQPSTLSLPLQLASPLSCSLVVLVGFPPRVGSHTSSAAGPGPSPFRIRVVSTKPVCKYHLQPTVSRGLQSTAF